MKAVVYLICLFGLWMLLFAGRSPEPVSVPAQTVPRAQAGPDADATLAPSTDAPPITAGIRDTAAIQSISPAMQAAQAVAQASPAQDHSPRGQQLYLVGGAVVAGLLGLRLTLRRTQVGERHRSRRSVHQKGLKKPHHDNKTHKAKGLWISLAILCGLVLTAATLLAAAGTLGLLASMGFSVLLWMSLGILCALVVLAGIIALLRLLLHSLDLYKKGFWGTIALFLLIVVVGVPLAMGLGALIFWIFLNLFLAITVSIFAAVAVMGIVLPGLCLAILAMVGVLEAGKKYYNPPQ